MRLALCRRHDGIILEVTESGYLRWELSAVFLEGRAALGQNTAIAQLGVKALAEGSHHVW